MSRTVSKAAGEKGTGVLHGLVDIAVNLTDPVFRGVDYKGRRVHDDDFDLMMERAAAVGVDKMIITGTSYRQSIEAIQLCRRYPDRLRCTVGVHPAHCQEFESLVSLTDESQIPAAELTDPSGSTQSVAPEEDVDKRGVAHLEKVIRLIEENRDVVVAVGEIGLDYAELSMCPREVQHKYFEKQFRAYASLGLPFLFHSRDCGNFFVDALERFIAEEQKKGLGDEVTETIPTIRATIRGVVHSFNGTVEEQERLLRLGLLLSVNGSALRTHELASQVARIPLDRLLLETDAPWCDIRKKDYGYQFIQTHMETNKRGKPFVMGKCLERRNEPCHLVQVMEAFLGAVNANADECGEQTKDTSASITVLTAETLIQKLQYNSERIFGW